MNVPVITYDAAVKNLSWVEAVEALRAGHELARADVKDIFLGPAHGTFMSRGAYIEGLGYGVKSFTVFDQNAKHGLPSVQGAMLFFEHEHGQLRAIIESRLITEFKTAADSVLGASLLMRPNSKNLLIVGAGTVARSLVRAYSAVFPQLERIALWSRRPEQAEAVVQECTVDTVDVVAVRDLAAAAGEADIISTATLAREPVLKGKWIKPGTHVDLIGAFKADMREADDELIAGGILFVDSRDTTIGHIGELMIPMAKGVIDAEHINGDFYDIIKDPTRRRQSENEITVFKNGGGAHLDLMMACYIAKKTLENNAV